MGKVTAEKRVKDRLQLVIIGVQGWNVGLETLSYPDVLYQLLEFAPLLERRPGHCFPVVEYILWESLATGS